MNTYEKIKNIDRLLPVKIILYFTVTSNLEECQIISQIEKYSGKFINYLVHKLYL